MANREGPADEVFRKSLGRRDETSICLPENYQGFQHMETARFWSYDIGDQVLINTVLPTLYMEYRLDFFLFIAHALHMAVPCKRLSHGNTRQEENYRNFSKQNAPEWIHILCYSIVALS